MKIYSISGLGADQRVFDRLNLNFEIVPIDWIDPEKNESIENYARRLSVVIDQNEPFILMGVSFGGLIAIELSKILNPKLTILISSAQTKNELRKLYKVVGKSGLIKLLPKHIFDLPAGLASFIFGTKEKELLSNILNDTEQSFTKWAIHELTNWQNDWTPKNLITIHGSKDKLIPSSNPDYLIEGGEHFMIVDKADEISGIINEEIRKLE